MVQNTGEVLRTLTVQPCLSVTDTRHEDAAIMYLDTVDLHILHTIHISYLLEPTPCCSK